MARPALSFIPTNKSYYAVFIITAAVLLAGCKGGGSSGGRSGESSGGGAVTPPTINQPYEKVIIRYSENIGEWSIIDLRANLQGSPTSDSKARQAFFASSYIKDAVLSEGADICSAPNISPDQKGIEVLANDYGDCAFDLVMVRNGKESSERLLVNYTQTPEQKVPALSQTLTPGQSATINLATSSNVKPFIDAGYKLESHVELFGDITVAATVDTNTLTLTASNNPGPNRVFYFLKKADDSKIGILDVTVTSTANNGPVIKYPKYSREIHSRTVENFYLSDNDNDNDNDIVIDPDSDAILQIIRLESPLGGALDLGPRSKPLTGYDPDNMVFHFKSDQVGSFPVSYTVTDHKGGYATGTVTVHVGTLTSPNTVLANTPGRMVETVNVGDDINNINIPRPLLFDEVKQALPDLNPIYASRTMDNEKWAYLTREEADSFCKSRGQDWRTPTATALTALVKKYAEESDKMTGTIGWPTGRYNNKPNNDDTTTLFYNIQRTGRSDTHENTAINAVTGALDKTEQRGLVICVNSPQDHIVLSEHNISLSSSEPQKVLPLLYWQYSVKPICEKIREIPADDVSAEPVAEEVIATCTVTGTESQWNVTIDGLNRGVAIFEVRHPSGENLNHSIEPATLTVANDYKGQAKPLVTNFRLQAWLDNRWQTVVKPSQTLPNNLFSRVRVNTHLKIAYDYIDPDDWQVDKSEIRWDGSLVVVDREYDIWRVNAYTDQQDPPNRVTITPKNNYNEVGTPQNLSFRVLNEKAKLTIPLTYDELYNPVTLRGGDAFQATTRIDAEPVYTDENNDPEQEQSRAYLWESKSPWAGSNDWSKLDLDEKTMPEAMRKGFFTPGHALYGHDLRVTVYSRELYASSIDEDKVIIPITNGVSNSDIDVTVNGNLVKIRHMGRLQSPPSTVNDYDRLCQSLLSEPGESGQVLRESTKDALSIMIPAPKFYSNLYVTDDIVPVASSKIEHWNITNNRYTPDLPNGLVCEITGSPN